MPVGILPQRAVYTNATIATVALIRDHFPGKAVSERRLLLNQGLMNGLACFFGGMPMCHGAQGLAGQYYFGARTGGASILEGLIEIGLGLFLSDSLLGLFRTFPESILGAMMVLVAFQLIKPVARLRGQDLGFALFTGLLSALTNIALGRWPGCWATTCSSGCSDVVGHTPNDLGPPGVNHKGHKGRWDCI